MNTGEPKQFKMETVDALNEYISNPEVLAKFNGYDHIDSIALCCMTLGSFAMRGVRKDKMIKFWGLEEYIEVKTEFAIDAEKIFNGLVEIGYLVQLDSEVNSYVIPENVKMNMSYLLDS